MLKKKQESTNILSYIENLKDKALTTGSRDYLLLWGAKRAGIDDPFALYSNKQLDGVSYQFKTEMMVRQAKYECTLLSYCVKLVLYGQFPCINEECVKLAEYFTANELANGVVVDIVGRK
jgi:hypothetical protein